MQLEVGSILEGKVSGIAKFGAFVSLDDKTTGMVHISEISSTFVNDINEVLKEGQTVKVKVMSIDDNGKIALSIKKAAPPVKRAPKAPTKLAEKPGEFEWKSKKASSGSFEDMMAQFKQVSDEKLSDLKRVTDAHNGSRRK